MPPLPKRYRDTQKKETPPVCRAVAAAGRVSLFPTSADRSEKKDRIKYVYALVDSTFTRVKFGSHRHDPRAGLRKKALQTGSPHRLYLLAFTTDPPHTEGEILRRYFPLNTEGGGREWRPLTATFVKDVSELCVWSYKDDTTLAWVKAALIRRDLGIG